MKITIDYNNDEIRIEEAGPVASFRVDRGLGRYQELLEEIFNKLAGQSDGFLNVEILAEDEDKRRVIGEW